MIYEAKKFDHLLGTAGFSDQLLKNHFTLYEGYAANFKKLAESIMALEDQAKAGAPEYAELKRRAGWEWNGMRLHELYFENLSQAGTALSPDGKLSKKIAEDFGSFEAWLINFKSVGVMRGIGWVILYHDRRDDKLYNVWANEHDTGHFAGATPLLIMDVFEHAYMIDYNLKKADYIEAFVKAINWPAVEKRF